MARIRTIKPELHSSASLARCSVGARWVFVGLFTLADDAGRIRDLPKQILGNLFPLDNDVTVEMVVAWLDELEAVCCIRRYSIDGSNFIYLPGWTDHQRISKPTPSRIPGPPQGIPGNPAESSVEVEVEVRSGKGNGNGLGAGDAREPGEVVHRPNPNAPPDILCLRHEDTALTETLARYPDDPAAQSWVMGEWRRVNGLAS